MTAIDAVDTRGYVLEVYQDQEDASWVAEVPDLPGCLAAGETLTEALALVGDAIAAWIEAARSDGRAVPAPRAVEDEYSGRFVLRLPRTLHRRLAGMARREGVSLNTYCVTALAETFGYASGRQSITSWRHDQGLAFEAYSLSFLTGHAGRALVPDKTVYETKGHGMSTLGFDKVTVVERRS